MTNKMEVETSDLSPTLLFSKPSKLIFQIKPIPKLPNQLTEI